jgi:hypothetical protein
MRSISRGESESNSSELDERAASFSPILRHKVRHDGRKTGAPVRWNARRITPCVGLAAAYRSCPKSVRKTWVPRPRLRPARKILLIQLTEWIDA